MAGIKDGRIGMFQDGPYWMGLLKDGAPEHEGRLGGRDGAVLRHAAGQLPGRHRPLDPGERRAPAGGLARSTQYMLEPPQQIGVYTVRRCGAGDDGGAEQVPRSPKPDPYFGGQAPFPIFLEAMSTATHFPYVAQWGDIDTEHRRRWSSR